jgi:hypothetical protein
MSLREHSHAHLKNEPLAGRIVKTTGDWRDVNAKAVVAIYNA